MTKDFFIEETQRLKDQLEKLKEDYIEANKPYPIGTKVKMMLGGSLNRIVEGEILTVGISHDKTVYVTSYKCDKDHKVHYCTVPQQKYKLLE